MRPHELAELPGVVLRTYRVGGVVRRVRHEMDLRTGLAARRTVPRGLPSAPGACLLPSADLEAARAGYLALPDADRRRAALVADAERVLGGELRFFGGRWLYVGWPPQWLYNPDTGYEHDPAAHWTAVSDHDLEAGDIKLVWEASRFSWAYTFARAFAVTGEDRWPEAFWTAFEDWLEANPLHQGPNWSCGQESSIRATAVLFTLRAFGSHASSTSERLALAHRMLRGTGQRVAATIGYAASQRNNHAISEATCLLLLGVLFPDWPEAGRWHRQGLRHLQAAVADQFYDDGGYAQHSFAYQRLAVQTLCWGLTVHRWVDEPPPDELSPAILRSLALLRAVQDEGSGHMPNLGANDGAMLLALSGCDYRDFRPSLQAASVLATGQRCYEPGVWDEEALWLTDGHLPPTSVVHPPPARPDRVETPQAGLLITRGAGSMALLRVAPPWRHRPSQADDLHVDVWISGHEVAMDPGTYRYTALPPWDNGLASSRVHNTVTIDGEDRMRRLGRFLWGRWPHTRVLVDVGRPSWQAWVVESDVPVWEPIGAGHRRFMLRYGGAVLVADLVHAQPPSVPEVQWTLPSIGVAHRDGTVFSLDGPGWFVEVHAPADSRIEERIGGPGPRGWRSSTYAEREPVRSVVVRCPRGESVTAALFAPGPVAGDRNGLLAAAATVLSAPSAEGVEAFIEDARWWG